MTNDKCDLVFSNGVKEKKMEVIDDYTIKYHANGKTMWSKGKMIDSYPDGYWEWYRLDGTIKRSGYFNKGEPVGEWVTYDSKGQKYKSTYHGDNKKASKGDYMKLSNEQLKDIYYGAFSICEIEDGYLQSFQYTQQQMQYFKESSEFWYDRCNASSAKTLEFSTRATLFSLEYKIIWVGSEDTIELAVDGLITKIYYVKELQEEGKISFEMPVGEKKVMVYLPADATILIRNFEINADVFPVKKREKVLWMGDSITQGYGPLRSAHTYVSVANRLLNYDIINQGIGGYIYDKNVLVNMEGYSPEKIIISLGTNQYGTESMKDIEEYYERLSEVYGDRPVLCITPIWRGDSPDGVEVLAKFCQKTKDICAKYSNITVVTGFKLVPHASEYFLDNLHPNALGSEIYGRNLVLAIHEAGF